MSTKGALAKRAVRFCKTIDIETLTPMARNFSMLIRDNMVTQASSPTPYYPYEHGRTSGTQGN